MKAKKYTVKELQEKLTMALSPDKPLLTQLEQLGVKELIEELSIYQQELEYQNDELRKTQVDLEKSKRYAEDLFENAPIPYVILNEDFEMMRFNELFVASFARSPIEIAKNTDFRRLIRPEDQDDFHRFLMQEGDSQQRNGITLQVGGRYFHIRAQQRVIEGVPDWRVSLTDLHNEQMVLAALSQSERRFRNLVEMAPDVIFTMKGDNKMVTYVSQQVELLLGVQAANIIGTHFVDYVLEEDKDLAKTFLDALDQLSKGDPAAQCELRFWDKSGASCWTEILGQKIHDSESQKHYFLCIAHPIEHLKQQATDLKVQNERLQHFSYIVSHNLSSYVANVHALVGLMSEQSLSEVERQETQTELTKASATLMEAVSHLNEMLKIQKNGPMGKVQMPLKQEIVKVLKVLKSGPQASDVEVDLDVPEGAVVCLHPAYLQSILLNLCSNAFRYKQPYESPRLRIGYEVVNDGSVVLSFQDNGLGMDLSVIGNKLFGMFQTFHDHPDAKGLGLFMVKHQLEAMGGRIKVESKMNEGTRFDLIIPACTDVKM